MLSPQKLAANRANAKKSTGPRTPEGKAVSSRNAEIRSLFKATIPMRGESSDRFSDLMGRFIALYRPSDDMEIELIHRLAVMTWRQMRLWGIESIEYSKEVEKQLIANPELASADPLSQAGAAYRAMSDQSHFQTRVNADESRLDRKFYKALKELQSLKKRKKTNPPCGD